MSRLNRPRRANQRCFPRVKPALKSVLRCMSYNVRIDHGQDQLGPHCWQKRKKKIVELLRGFSPDVIGLQEPNGLQMDFLHAALKEYSFIDYAPHEDKVLAEHLPIAYLQGPLECGEQGRFWLSETPSVPSLGWDSCYQRICSFAHFTIRTSRKSFWVFNTHFDHKGEVAREKSAALLVKKVEEIAGSDTALVMGDFNLFPNAAGQKAYALLQQGFEDVRDQKTVHDGPDGSWIGWEYDPMPSPKGQVGSRLDHIFIRGKCTVLREGVLNAAVGDDGAIVCPYQGLALGKRDYPSDHLPLIADMNLSR